MSKSFSFASFSFRHAAHKETFRKMHPVDNDDDMSVVLMMEKICHNGQDDVRRILYLSSVLFRPFKMSKNNTQFGLGTKKVDWEWKMSVVCNSAPFPGTMGIISTTMCIT